MKKVVRQIARFFLWALTAAVPFVIAACYGVMYEYDGPNIFTYRGRVIDRVTREGVSSISLQCLRFGDILSSSSTEPDGSFEFSVTVEQESGCDEISATDIDGSANGSYQNQTVDMTVTGTDDIIIILTPEP